MRDGYRGSQVIEEFARRLREARGALLRRVQVTDDELTTLEVHQPGGPIEDVAAEMVTAVLSRLEGREKHELDEIAAAEARLHGGTFGTCEVCGWPIPVERLRAMPTARRCVGCQARDETGGG
jgi:RNA polymerase-binding protein DksA